MITLNGVEFTRTGNPQTDLVNYAKARGISEAVAKEELEAEFGIPETIENQDKDDNVGFEYVTLNDVSFYKSGNAQVDLEVYANLRGISEDAAKEELEAEFGIQAPPSEQKNETKDVSDVDNYDTTNKNNFNQNSFNEYIKSLIIQILETLGIDTSFYKAN